ncbi:hypothetical protein PFICI_10427 [Pestalotiopsis fici W106-1]|uniref:Zn(2)-C6 fungal-type domain-containing protein n=1 Tax=Pestalotiopsis fici (strain W106-1 / CGMCC3.15140) TaxID=1229662 RepID=W3WWZ1_PESFW|nr:uncharacterized protein PFICI_10427 [Pestalotiopsis fici W106-1]ETS78365.1 hypothetical protein PFICI_10427 [Pestalotiopsis fici W106-1]
MYQELDQLPAAGKGRRRIPACLRCRARKVKCDNRLPTCSNCEKAAVECDQAANSDKLHAKQLEERIKVLESIVRIHAPHVSLDDDLGHDDYSTLEVGENHAQASLEPPREANKAPQESSPVTTSGRSGATATGTDAVPSPSVHGSQIGPEQPLAHEVGLLSLGNTASDPKYLGPSSGFTLARLTYAAIPQSQGLPSAADLPRQDAGFSQNTAPPRCAPLPSLPEMHRFIGAYVDAFHSQYPFLQEGKIEQIVEVTLREPQAGFNKASLDDAMLFLVAALGARILEQGRQLDLKSAEHLASAMAHVSALQLHDSVQGVQVMLLLVLASFIFPEGSLNAWFLSSAIVASCVDLGLQRRSVPAQREGNEPETEALENVRCGIFWSAYSIDRTLCTTLGRPLNLRDEAIDIDFPGEIGSSSSGFNAVMSASQPSQQGYDAELARFREIERSSKRRRLDQTTGLGYTASAFFFRFDRITAEIKLMLYRVAQAPWRFPWPSNYPQWQSEALASCDDLLSSAREILLSQVLVPSHYRRLLPSLEIKYHQCVLLLFRPSPAISQPSEEAYRRCYESSREVLRIHAEQLRFGEIIESWLAAHLVFVSGITMIYSIFKLPDATKHLVGGTESADFDQAVSNCSEVLSRLGKTWPVARDANDKFTKLATRSKEMAVNAARGPPATQSGEVEAPGVSQETQTNDPLISAVFGCDGDIAGMPASSEFVWYELGVMSTWFDLDWRFEQ